MLNVSFDALNVGLLEISILKFSGQERRMTHFLSNKVRWNRLPGEVVSASRPLVLTRLLDNAWHTKL